MFLDEPPPSEARDSLYSEELETDGYVANNTRLWAWRPDILRSFAELRSGLMKASALTSREWAVLVVSTASTMNDSYCSLAWGARLAHLTDDETAAQVLSGQPASGLNDRERALADWARGVVRDPNGTSPADVDRLRDAGLADREIFEATAFIAFRQAFSTIDDALGAAPDHQLAEEVPPRVRAAVRFGRAPDAGP
jgi:uncharacterized peroxidase-related enzyme